MEIGAKPESKESGFGHSTHSANINLKLSSLAYFQESNVMLLYLQGQFAPIRGNYSPEFRSLVRFGNIKKICPFLQFLILQTNHLTYKACLYILKLWLFYIASTFIRWQTYFRKTQI